MGKSTIERELREKRREHEREHRGRMKTKTKVDGKYHKERIPTAATMMQHNNNDDANTTTKYNATTKSGRSFPDDLNGTSNLVEQRQHHHHHHRHRLHHHHHHHHQRHEQKNGRAQREVETPPTTKEAKASLEDMEEEEAMTVDLLHLDSPAMLSVSSSLSSLSTTHYSHSPAVIVDNESSHGHNKQQECSTSPPSITTQPVQASTTPKRLRSRSKSIDVDSEIDSQSLTNSTQSTQSTPQTSTRSKRSRSNRTSSLSDSQSSSSSLSMRSTHSKQQQFIAHAQAPTNDDIIIADLDVTATATATEKIDSNLPDYYPGVQGCRSVEEFQCLNRIEEGTYGVVYRAKDKKTNELVALKRLKMEKETEGFPITSLREINTLLKGQHPNIVTVREIVVGSNMDQIFIVMDYVEHDMKSLMQTMRKRKQSFLPSEVKCLTQQLLRAVAHLHDNWILHRDLKTSNLLLSHKGVLKVADFGLAREYGSPLQKYTPVVVTLWYRAPELLLGCREYSTPVDMWSVGCIFAEWLQMRPLFTGEKELDQLNRIFKELGTPNDKIWTGYKELPGVKNILSQNSQFTDYPISSLRKHFANITTDLGIKLLQGLLTYDPEKRLTAERALHHEYFAELPLPIDPSMFPTWPAKSELGERKQAAASPKPPPGGTQFKNLAVLDGALPTKGAGFQLRF